VELFLGVDGGGTKTSFAVADRSGNIKGAHTGTGSSYKQLGVDKAVNVLYENAIICLDKAGVGLSDLSGVCFGLPCYGENAQGDSALSSALKERFPKTPAVFVNDAEIGWAGSFAMQPGVSIAVGTGSIAFGKDSSGKSARCGGWHEFFSDEGSCYWLGRRTMELFTKQADGRARKNHLYRIIREAFSLEEDFAFIDIMESDYLPYRDKVASMQIYLEQASLLGDTGAGELYVQAAGELAGIVSGIAEQLDLAKPFPVSYSGGLFKAGALIMDPFSKKVSALGGAIQKPLLAPVHGALLLALSESSGGEAPPDDTIRRLARYMQQEGA